MVASCSSSSPVGARGLCTCTATHRVAASHAAARPAGTLVVCQCCSRLGTNRLRINKQVKLVWPYSKLDTLTGIHASQQALSCKSTCGWPDPVVQVPYSEPHPQAPVVKPQHGHTVVSARRRPGKRVEWLRQRPQRLTQLHKLRGALVPGRQRRGIGAPRALGGWHRRVNLLVCRKLTCCTTGSGLDTTKQPSSCSLQNAKTCTTNKYYLRYWLPPQNRAGVFACPFRTCCKCAWPDILTRRALRLAQHLALCIWGQ